MSKSTMRKSITIALPDSAVSDVFDIREKTIKLGMIARSLAIFEVKNLLIYKDTSLSSDKSKYERRFMNNVLSYIETPQYLRKTLFPFHKDLQFAGQLPPLATLHHPIGKLKSNQFRDGVLYLDKNNKPVVDVGFDYPLTIQKIPKMTLKNKKKRVTTFIQKNKDGEFIAEIIPRDAIEQKMYWGYKIKESNLPLSKLLKRDEFLVIATSKSGQTISEIDFNGILSKVGHKKQLLFLFGSPKDGLKQLLKGSETKINDISDLYVNILPSSGVRSIRLEEAIPITLAKLIPILT